MSKPSAFAPRWDTSSFGHPADTSPMECSLLADHLTECSRSRGPWQRVRLAGASLRSFVVPRMLTTALAAALIAGAVWLVA